MYIIIQIKQLKNSNWNKNCANEYVYAETHVWNSCCLLRFNANDNNINNISNTDNSNSWIIATDLPDSIVGVSSCPFSIIYFASITGFASRIITACPSVSSWNFIYGLWKRRNN
jgi:hypothetical protein